MNMDIASLEIKPKRQGYAHLAEKFGEDRTFSRYEEAVFCAQPTENFHYRPQWDVQNEIFDVNRTKIVMKDWEDLVDPRKFHYMTYVSTRAKQNATSIDTMTFLEKRMMLSKLSDEDIDTVIKYITPLRHYFYGANMNNLELTAKGYGGPFCSATQFQAEDELGFGQHVTKIILDITNNDTSILDAGKDAWLNEPQWQGLRKAMEDSFVVKDYMELFIIQNVVFDGFIIPLMFSSLPNNLSSSGNIAISMMSEFILLVTEETNKWTDSIVKVVSSESEENKALLTKWINKYINITQEALSSLDPKAVTLVKNNLVERLNKSNLSL
jgi:phenol hydroxylase P1 protein